MALMYDDSTVHTMSEFIGTDWPLYRQERPLG